MRLRIMLFNQTFQNINRAREIISVLFKYGFEDFITNTPLKNVVPKQKQMTWLRQEKRVFELTRWERLRMVIEELGATFVKGGQVLSNRPDILPKELIKELEKLQNQVPAFKGAIAKKIIAKELEKPLEEVFAYFNEKPIGSASIGQVHAARLHTGEKVVIKVQRPNVRKQVETDLAIIKEIVRLTEGFFEQNGIHRPMDVVLAFESIISKELDYSMEARNIAQFRSFYAAHEEFYVPKVFTHLSTEQILVLEFIKGCKITNVEQMKAWGLDPRKIAEIGLNVYLTQIFEFGFFHADPHPGNVLVREDGVLCLIDFGMVGRLMLHDKYAFAGIFIGLAQQNPRMMAKSLRRLAIQDNIEDTRQLEYDLSEIIQSYAMINLSDASMAELATKIQKLIYNYQLQVPGSVFIILRTLAILEGIGKQIHPNLKAFELMKPYGRKLLQEQYSPQSIGFEAYSMVSEVMDFVYNFPGELNEIVQKVSQGKFHAEIRIEDYEKALNKADHITNRLSLTMLTVALYLSSAITMSSNAKTVATWFGHLPLISLLLLIAAIALSCILILGMSRRE